MWLTATKKCVQLICALVLHVCAQKRVDCGGTFVCCPSGRAPRVAVQAIKRHHLVELRSMANPPLPVKTVLEAICLLLGEPAHDWRAIRAILLSDSFINTIVYFNAMDIT